ncbi:MAG: hypothetical protein HUU41_02950 [Bryobacteraceae bacterium]|nr:hypothetical protein [Bryobacterales bacterium]NUN00048.1 hypothetical protein [Bryobacteraceae bacterium]
MDMHEIQARVSAALGSFVATDRYLLEYDLSERCISARIALHLQPLFPDHFVDVEYNRVGQPPKRLAISEDCANYRNKKGEALAVPDVIVHRRGPEGPNLLVMEFKKTSNPDGFDCDRQRIAAFKEQLGYRFGALVECETRRDREPDIRVIEWLE